MSANRLHLNETEEFPGAVDFAIEQFQMHPQFNVTPWANDIAWLKLRPLNGSSSHLVPLLRPVSLDTTDAGAIPDATGKRRWSLVEWMKRGGSATLGALKNIVDDVDYGNVVNRGLYAAGWGSVREGSHTPSATAQSTRMRITFKRDCWRSLHFAMPQEQIVCAVGADPDPRRRYSDTCQGDSGGPLYTDHDNGNGTAHGQVLIGIVSNGIGCGEREGWVKERPGIYTNVYYHRAFIQQAIDLFRVKSDDGGGSAGGAGGAAAVGLNGGDAAGHPPANNPALAMPLVTLASHDQPSAAGENSTLPPVAANTTNTTNMQMMPMMNGSSAATTYVFTNTTSVQSTPPPPPPHRSPLVVVVAPGVKGFARPLTAQAPSLAPSPLAPLTIHTTTTTTIIATNNNHTTSSDNHTPLTVAPQAMQDRPGRQ